MPRTRTARCRRFWRSKSYNRIDVEDFGIGGIKDNYLADTIENIWSDQGISEIKAAALSFADSVFLPSDILNIESTPDCVTVWYWRIKL